MQNVDMWKPTKFVYRRGRWTASRDPAQVSPASRLMASLIADAYASAITEHAAGSLVDIGCGHVPLYGCYSALVEQVTCIDWPNTTHPSPHLDFEVDLSEPLPLADASFQTIVITDVLEHLPYPDRTWSELARITSSGGVVIVGVPFGYWLHEEPHDHHRYTEYRLRLFCEDHGFDVVRLSPYGGMIHVLADTASKIVYRRRWARPAAVLIQWASLRLKRGDSQFPLGYVLVASRR